MKDSARSEEAILEKILRDPLFCSGDFYKELLRYLLLCRRDGVLPTEIDIALHVFGKKQDFDPAQDTLVRVYLFRLRSKLEKYYKGQENRIGRTIPKGNHSLEFVNVRTENRFPENLFTHLPSFSGPAHPGEAVLVLWRQNVSSVAVPAGTRG
jgi:hypothetical protein